MSSFFKEIGAHNRNDNSKKASEALEPFGLSLKEKTSVPTNGEKRGASMKPCTRSTPSTGPRGPDNGVDVDVDVDL